MSNLNSQQLAAAESAAINRVIVAGPGSGKTHTLVEIISRIKDADLGGVILISYTVAAAREIETRVRARLNESVELGYVGTLHGLMWSIMCAENRRWRGIVDEDAAMAILKQIASDMKANATAAEWRDLISRRDIICPVEAKKARTRQEVAAVELHKQLANDGLTTFDGVLVHGLKTLENRRKSGQRIARLLVWDEMQDSSKIDYEILHTLTAGEKVVVGDPDQSIYGFRGAKPELFVALTEDPMWCEYELSTNYRSNQSICDAANKLMRCDSNRIPKLTIPASTTPSRLTSTEWSDAPSASDELSLVHNRIRKLLDDAPKSEIAVLSRTNRQAKEFNQMLVSYQLREPKQQSQRLECLDLVQLLLGIMTNPNSNTLVARLVELTRGQSESVRLRLDADARMTPLWRSVWQDKPPSAISAVPGWLDRYEVPRETILHVSSLIEDLERRSDGQPVTVAQLQLALRESQNSVEEKDPDGVWCGTVHAAKGREWDHVILVGCEEDVWIGKGTPQEIQEGRRLFFVALTRARHSFTATCARSRVQYRGENVPPGPATERLPVQFLFEAGLKKVWNTNES